MDAYKPAKLAPQHGPDGFGSNDYECFHCKRPFVAGNVWSLSRAFERMHFGMGLPEVEVSDSLGLSCYCSPHCLRQHLPAAMQAEGVPIPAQPPEIGPIEVCAKCALPVDTSRWHRCYSTDGARQCSPMCLQPFDVQYVARLCNTCCPVAGAAALDAASERPQDAAGGPVQPQEQLSN